jgi:hypothetical protein
LRSCDQASQYIFETIEAAYSVPVDYFFATWDKTRDFWWPEEKSIKTSRPVTDHDITDKFNDRNLIGHRIIDQSLLPRQEITFYYQAHLAKVANILKRRHEQDNNFSYQQVIEIRPDIFMPYLPYRMECNSFEFQTGLMFFQDNNTRLPHSQDFYIRTNSFGNDVIANRVNHRKWVNFFKGHPRPATSEKFHANHWVLFDYFQQRRFGQVKSFENETQGQVPIRPNFPSNMNLRNYSSEYLKQLDREWIAYQWK